ncbi:fungal-specific transcription factor domain-domain-containing protein [Naematelia encephala]|uniref:Fungal-specific transcription factor domain-domain-containing protein n=1 Tax=Naematelia encephala TaxID=71784 RepID=A0A1Y2BBA2_9TREE|nr:fungal-specific transcription factor domain-domain-containing protein [Naematelia encephala]
MIPPELLQQLFRVPISISSASHVLNEELLGTQHGLLEETRSSDFAPTPPASCDSVNSSGMSGSSDNAPSTSSLRQESTGREITAIQPHEAGNQDSRIEGERKAKKRGRTSEPPSQGGKAEIAVLPAGLEGQELEYEDPSADPTKGPVYIHPPKGVVQACVRCHKLKRKCDSVRPRCNGCGKAGASCVFELNPATSVYLRTLKEQNSDLISRLTAAMDRVRIAEKELNSLKSGPSSSSRRPPEQSSHANGRSGGSARLSRPPDKVPGGSALGLSTGIASHSHPLLPARHTSSVRTSAHSIPDSVSVEQTVDPLYPSYLPACSVALRAVETFFLYHAVSYPMLEKRVILHDLHEVFDIVERRASDSQRGPESAQAARKGFTVFMVIAIGTNNMERLGEVDRRSSRYYGREAMKVFNAAVSKEDIFCVQSLILLGLYTMCDPTEISLWHVLGYAARVATSLNLHRRVESSGVSVEIVEYRKRVFYSLYNLDRLVSSTLSKPLAISDDDIDVELPSALHGGSPYKGITRIFFTRHIIKIRQLLGVIVTKAYSVSGSQNSLPEPDRAAIILDLHSRLDQWLAECPMPPREAEEERGMVTNFAWFLLNYHHCLCFLYRPSPLYPVTTMHRLRALYEASTRTVDLYIELWREQKIPENSISVNCQFLACICLLYCMCEFENRSAGAKTDRKWRQNVARRVASCQELLEAFGQLLPESTQYRKIFSKLADLLLAGDTPVSNDDVQSQTGVQDIIVTSKADDVISMAPGSSNYAQAVTYAVPSKPVEESQMVLPAASSSNAPVLQPTGAGSIIHQNSLLPTDPLFYSVKLSQDEESAWDAMTQLWYDSGDFVLDDSFNLFQGGPQGDWVESSNSFEQTIGTTSSNGPSDVRTIPQSASGQIIEDRGEQMDIFWPTGEDGGMDLWAQPS